MEKTTKWCQRQLVTFDWINTKSLFENHLVAKPEKLESDIFNSNQIFKKYIERKEFNHVELVKHCEHNFFGD